MICVTSGTTPGKRIMFNLFEDLAKAASAAVAVPAAVVADVITIGGTLAEPRFNK